MEHSSRTRLAVFARGRVFPGVKSHCGAWIGAKGKRNAFNSKGFMPGLGQNHAPQWLSRWGKLVRARTRPGVFATNVPFSLQVSHHCLCSFHIYEVLILYFTTRTSARSRGFRLLLPLSPILHEGKQWKGLGTHCSKNMAWL